MNYYEKRCEEESILASYLSYSLKIELSHSNICRRCRLSIDMMNVRYIQRPHYPRTATVPTFRESIRTCLLHRVAVISPHPTEKNLQARFPHRQQVWQRLPLPQAFSSDTGLPQPRERQTNSAYEPLETMSKPHPPLHDTIILMTTGFPRRHLRGNPLPNTMAFPPNDLQGLATADNGPRRH